MQKIVDQTAGVKWKRASSFRCGTAHTQTLLKNSLLFLSFGVRPIFGQTSSVYRCKSYILSFAQRLAIRVIKHRRARGRGSIDEGQGTGWYIESVILVAEWEYQRDTVTTSTIVVEAWEGACGNCEFSRRDWTKLVGFGCCRGPYVKGVWVFVSACEQLSLP